MRVLVFAGSLAHTQAGAAHATLDFTNALGASGRHDVHLYTTEYEPESVDPSVRVTTYQPPRSLPVVWRFKHLTAIPQQIREARRHALPDVDLCYTQGLTWGMAFRKWRPRVPIVSHTGGVINMRERIEEMGGTQCPWYVRADGMLLNRLERQSYAEDKWAHIVSTRFVARQRAAYFGVSESTFSVCPYGLSLTKFDSAAAYPEVRPGLSIPQGAPIVLTVSRLVKLKNTDTLMKAFAGTSMKDAYLVVVGDGPERARLTALADELGIANRTRFTGHSPDPAAYYAAADVFAMPSLVESFGIVYGEAMLMKLPCLGLRNDPPRVLSAAEDVIVDGTTGFCVTSQEELTARLDTLLVSADLRRRMGEAGNARARKLYASETYLESVLTLARTRFGCDC